MFHTLRHFSTTPWRTSIICVMSCAGCLLPCEYATINCRLERAKRAGLPPFVCLGITCAMQKMAHSGSVACRTWNALPSDLIDAEWIPCGARKHGGCLFWQKLCPQMMTIHRSRAAIEGFSRVCQSAAAVKTLLAVSVMKWSGKLSRGCNGKMLQSCV